MNLNHKSSKILITGNSGSGKSTYLTAYLEGVVGTVYKSVYIFDHQNEYEARTGCGSAKTEEELAKANEKGLVVFDPSELFPGETEAAWNFFCEWVFERCKANIGHPKLLVVDELQMFSSTAQLSFELSCVIETGRKFELDFVCITQQMNLIHNRLRNQATEITTFRHYDLSILDALEDLGFDPEEVSRLNVGDYLCRDMTTSTIQRGNTFSTGQIENKSQCSGESDAKPDGGADDNNEENNTNE